MELKKAIWERRSIRKFKKIKVPREKLYEIFEAGVQAPSSCNQQMFYIIIIDDENLKIRLEKEAGFKLISRIPNPIFVITDKRFSNDKFANIQGASAAIQNMLIYAYSLGIGSCWIAGYGDKAIVKKILNIPKHFHVLGCVGFGYPDEKPLPPLKRDVRSIVFFNRSILPLTASKNPEEWSYDEIKGISARAIFAKSPEIGYLHLFPLELKNHLDFISSKIGRNVLYLDDISGIYLFELAKLRPDVKFTMISHSKEIIGWMKEKSEFHKTKNIYFEYSEELKPKNKNYDTVLCLDLFNRIPSSERIKIAKSSYESLKKGGNIILSFINKNSVYGFLFRNGVGRRYGPEISLSWAHISNILLENNFRINEKRGFNLLPSPRLFFKMGVPGRYTFLNKYLRFLTRYNFFEDSISKGFNKYFSTTGFIIGRKN